MSEKPLHVRVAEALGCKLVAEPHPMACVDATLPDYFTCGCPPDRFGYRPHGLGGIARYDTNWAAMGPLIERFHISLHAAGDGRRWFADAPDSHLEPTCVHVGGFGSWAPCADRSDSPLVSACHAILALMAPDPYGGA